ncbi:hypothetical protein AWM75_07725 [Aerococcus urinaehominis]|uniref:Shikimate kinase n=1 Tax=Aerococcus urinaehominis TaxID=128944 RepID=A0A109RHG9_9LACT|nr:shikimate kinase [Aerococcus urinaehominis]AMB99861.1 hypothetical protein AWM75_07725 [Aerococcus urinaehominis]SDM54032.1 shikimate kinase [Aerococcus urinaehominis]
MSIYLIGFMGAGKTTVGRILADRLNQPFVDLDDYIADQAGLSVPEIFEQFGEGHFRQLELQAIQASLDQPGVIATGGGCVETPAVCQLLSQADRVYYLQADFDALYQRIQQDTETIRPLAQPGQEAATKARYLARQARYQEAGGQTINTDLMTPDQVAEWIINDLERRDHHG